MRTILGIDPGISEQNPAGIAIVRFLPDTAPELVLHETFLARVEPTVQKRRPKKTAMVSDPYDRAVELSHRISQLLANRVLSVVSLEDAHYQMNQQTTIKLAVTVGCIIGAIGCFPYQRLCWQPSQWRKWAFGVGNLSKDVQRATVAHQFSVDEMLLTDHEVAACGLCLAAQMWLETPEEQREPSKKKARQKRKPKQSELPF